MSITSILLRRDPVAVVGTVLSLALSIALDLTGAASGVESLLAALGGITVALLLDSIVRAERRFQLRQMVEMTPWFGRAVHPLAQGAREIEQLYPGSLIVAETREKFERLREDLADLSRGRIERDGSDYRYLIEPSLRVRYRIEAVTNIGLESDRLAWWEDDIGRHYWQTNLNALARGVRITRIFTYVEMTPALARIIDEQSAAGVETIVLPHHSVSEALQMNFTVWDDGSAWEARLNARGAIVANIYTVNTHDVARLRAAFQRLTLAAAHGA